MEMSIPSRNENTDLLIHVQIFKTSSGQMYAYDPFTNRILKIHSSLYHGIDEATVVTKIRSYLEQNRLTQVGTFTSAQWRKDISTNVGSQLKTLVLQISRRCNLACEYCVYSGNYRHMHPHADEDMTKATLMQSIDYFAKHCSQTDSLGISFYGGEALLQFELVRYGVEYARRKLIGKQISFSISSNGTTLDPSVVNWLCENPDVSVTITVNGPFHDQYRKTVSGHGSLSLIMKKLNHIKHNYPAIWHNQIRFIANKTSDIQLEELRYFYEEEIGKPPEIVTAIRDDMGNQHIKSMLNLHNDSTASVQRLYKEYVTTKVPFLQACFDPRVAILHDREIYTDNTVAYVSSCVPMSNRLFVRSDGSFNICERVSDELYMGCPQDGVDAAITRDLCSKLLCFVEKQCLTCWAQRLCTFCFQDIIDENGTIIDHMPDGWCDRARKNLLESLIIYCELSEKSPERLDEFDVPAK